jgi:hypothetical protein
MASGMLYSSFLLENAANSLCRSIIVIGGIHRQQLLCAELDTLFCGHLCATLKYLMVGKSPRG